MSKRLEELKKMLDQGESDFLLFALAKEFELLGKDSEALETYLSAISKYPNYAGTYFHLGKLYETMGNEENAVSIYKKGIEVCEAQQELHYKKELIQALLEIDSDEDN